MTKVGIESENLPISGQISQYEEKPNPEISQGKEDYDLYDYFSNLYPDEKQRKKFLSEALSYSDEEYMSDAYSDEDDDYISELHTDNVTPNSLNLQEYLEIIFDNAEKNN